MGAKTYTWNANFGSGNWNTAAAWNHSNPAGGFPGNVGGNIGDTVVLGTGAAAYTVTDNVTAQTILQLSINSGGTATLVIASGIALTATAATATAVNLADGTINLGGSLTMNGAGGGITVAAAGTVNMQGGNLSGVIASAGNIIGNGTLTGAVSGAGVYEALGGILRITGNVAATATGLEVGAASTNTLRLDGTVAAGATVTFLGSSGTGGVLDLTAPAGFSSTATISVNVGTDLVVANNSAINFSGLTVNTAVLSGAGNTTLTVGTSGGTFTLKVAAHSGTLTGAFANISGTDVFISTACYSRGTLIRTETDEVAVEDLAIGDRVMTISGEAKPVKWIGWRAYDGRFISGNREILPVRIAAGALADGVPARDLFLSPEHSLYIDKMLVPAEHLINGATITQAERVEQVEYFHVELAAHDVIFAEGTPADSYVDCDNRLKFANGAEYALLYPNDDAAKWQFCAPRLEEGAPELTAIRARIARRAGLPEEVAAPVESSTDRLPNPTLDGAEIGRLGASGALPAGWRTYSAAELNFAVVGQGEESGIDYVDIRVFGKASATTLGNQIFFAGREEIAVTPGERWTVDAHVSLRFGSLANVRAIQIGANLIDADGKYSSWFRSAAITPLPGSLARRRFARSGPITDRNAAYLQPVLQIATMEGGMIDLTLRIGRPRAAILGQSRLPQQAEPQHTQAA
jgi:hypothetical protein